jgi:hypothetical protein
MTLQQTRRNTAQQADLCSSPTSPPWCSPYAPPPKKRRPIHTTACRLVSLAHPPPPAECGLTFGGSCGLPASCLVLRMAGLDHSCSRGAHTSLFKVLSKRLKVAGMLLAQATTCTVQEEGRRVTTGYCSKISATLFANQLLATYISSRQQVCWWHRQAAVQCQKTKVKGSLLLYNQHVLVPAC